MSAARPRESHPIGSRGQDRSIVSVDAFSWLVILTADSRDEKKRLCTQVTFLGSSAGRWKPKRKKERNDWQDAVWKRVSSRSTDWLSYGDLGSDKLCDHPLHLPVLFPKALEAQSYLEAERSSALLEFFVPRSLAFTRSSFLGGQRTNETGLPLLSDTPIDHPSSSRLSAPPRGRADLSNIISSFHSFRIRMITN